MKIILKTFIKISNQPLLIPFYHMVSDKEDTFAKYLYAPRKIENFKSDLAVLLKYYQPISLKKMIEISQSKEKLNKNVFHLTFDDGLANFYTIVAPILSEKNIPATVFVNTDFVDNKALFFRYKASLLIQFYEKSSIEIKQKFHNFLQIKEEIKEALLKIDYHNQIILDELANEVNYSFNNFLEKEKPYLTKEQIKDLLKRGFTVGAHSKDHPLFANLKLEEQLKQAKDSLQWLQENFDIDYNAFSFPFTDLGVPKEFFFKMKPLIDVSFGTSGIKKDNYPTNFHRISLETGTKNTEKVLLKAHLKYLIKIPFRKHILRRK